MTWRWSSPAIATICDVPRRPAAGACGPLNGRAWASAPTVMWRLVQAHRAGDSPAALQPHGAPTRESFESPRGARPRDRPGQCARRCGGRRRFQLQGLLFRMDGIEPEQLNAAASVAPVPVRWRRWRYGRDLPGRRVRLRAEQLTRSPSAGAPSGASAFRDGSRDRSRPGAPAVPRAGRCRRSNRTRSRRPARSSGPAPRRTGTSRMPPPR